MMVRFRGTPFAQRFFRYSPCSRGEHEGERFEQTCFESIFTLPRSCEQEEVTHSRFVLQIF
jgi:hypothetical protein